MKNVFEKDVNIKYSSYKGRLYGKLFYKLKCRVLIIQDTPIKEIDEHTFYGINETLQELHVVSEFLVCMCIVQCTLNKIK